MSDFEIDGIKYRSKKMSAKEQFHIVCKIAPLLDAFRSMLNDSDGEGFKTFAVAISTIPDATVDYVIDECMCVVQRSTDGRGWADIWSKQAGRSMFKEIDDDLGLVMKIVFNVLKDAIGPFFSALPQKSNDVA